MCPPNQHQLHRRQHQRHGRRHRRQQRHQRRRQRRLHRRTPLLQPLTGRALSKRLSFLRGNTPVFSGTLVARLSRSSAKMLHAAISSEMVQWLSLVAAEKFRTSSATAEVRARLKRKKILAKVGEAEVGHLRHRHRRRGRHHRRLRHLQMVLLSLGRRRFFGLTTCTVACTGCLYKVGTRKLGKLHKNGWMKSEVQ